MPRDFLSVSLIEPLRYHRRVIRNRDNNQITLTTVSDRGGDFLKHFLNFIKRILSGHLSISVAVHLSLRHIYCEFDENRYIHIGDIK